MRIYAPVPADRSALLHPVNEADFDRIAALTECERPITEWPAIPFELVTRCDTFGQLKLTDAPWLGAHAIILSDRAAQSLRSLLVPHVELWPVRAQGQTFYLLHPRQRLDALDEQNSDITRFDDGRAMFINSYAFLGQKCLGRHAFKISSLKVSPVFVSEEFVQAWRSDGLVGLEFDMLWTQNV